MKQWMTDNIELLVLLILLCTVAAIGGCSSRPNVTSYMKKQEASLAVERCIERFLYMTRGKTASIDFELQVVAPEQEQNDSGQHNQATVELGSMLCTALYRPETFEHMPTDLFLAIE